MASMECRRSTSNAWRTSAWAIVSRIVPLLEAEGIVVDVLPATVPPGYDADAFLSIHADGSTGSAPRGWKLATPWRASQASKALLRAVAGTYGEATGMPEDVGGVGGLQFTHRDRTGNRTHYNRHD